MQCCLSISLIFWIKHNMCQIIPSILSESQRFLCRENLNWILYQSPPLQHSQVDPQTKSFLTRKMTLHINSVHFQVHKSISSFSLTNMIVHSSTQCIDFRTEKDYNFRIKDCQSPLICRDMFMRQSPHRKLVAYQEHKFLCSFTLLLQLKVSEEPSWWMLLSHVIT